MKTSLSARVASVALRPPPRSPCAGLLALRIGRVQGDRIRVFERWQHLRKGGQGQAGQTLEHVGPPL